MSDFTTSAAPAATPAPTSTPDALSLDALKAVADLLGGGEVVAYRPVFAHVFGGATPALLLSQFWFWTNTPTVKGRDGWFYKTQREITQETGLTRRETDTTRRKLVALGVLSENLRGVPATQHYHLHKERLYQLLWEHLEKQKASEKTDTSQFVRNRQTGLHKSAKLDCTKAPNKLARNRQTITETTPETTSKRTQTRARPGVLPSASGEQTRMEQPKTERPKAPDPLTALPAPEYAELEIQARAQLVTENRSPVSDSLRQGKSHRLVKQRMREMLAATGIMKPLDTLRSHSPDTDHPC